MYMFKTFCTRKERKLRGEQTIHFRFYLSKLKPYLSPYLVLSALVAGEQITTCFSVKKKCNPPACTSFPVPVGTIFVVLMI